MSSWDRQRPPPIKDSGDGAAVNEYPSRRSLRLAEVIAPAAKTAPRSEVKTFPKGKYWIDPINALFTRVVNHCVAVLLDLRQTRPIS
jgi:hypothetical protein